MSDFPGLRPEPQSQETRRERSELSQEAGVLLRCRSGASPRPSEWFGMPWEGMASHGGHCAHRGEMSLHSGHSAQARDHSHGTEQGRDKL